MALTPIPYTKNWKDVFGSQVAPPETLAKIALPTAVLDQTNNPSILLTVAHPDGVVIDWDDGSDPEPSVDAAVPHVYTRNGKYRIRTHVTGYPDVYVDTIVYVSSIQNGPLVINGTAFNKVVTLDVGDAVYPININWGDGSADYYDNPSSAVLEHTYATADTWTIQVNDADGRADTTVETTI